MNQSLVLRWSKAKNDRLQRERGASFEDIPHAEFLLVIAHPTRKNQRLLLFELRGYIWAAPCVIEGDRAFLKTMYPCRKYTRLWRKGRPQ